MGTLHSYLKLLAAVILLPIIGTAQTPIPGKYYEYYVIAKTGTTFTGLGTGPSINDAREVAFQGTTASGNGLWYGSSSSALVNFNPGESFSSSDIIGTSVQINANHQVVNEDRITTTSPATTSIRLYNATASDSFSYIARGGPSRTYDAVFTNPAVNILGDVVFTAFHPTPTKVLGFAPHGGGTILEKTIQSGNPKPMIADNGAVVIQVGGTGTQLNSQVLVYPPGFGSPIVIADTNSHWLSLDNDPGISRDGRIVAFQGNIDAPGAALIGTTNGPGIFVAIDEGAGFASAKILRITGGKVEDVAADRAAAKGNYDGICDVGEICKPAAELGFDGSGDPITIASYGTDSRVGVINVDFGAAGIDDDSFVVSFIATPSSASRDNPALPGTPLLFSAQQGLWTIRVDVQHQLIAPKLRVYHPWTPIPVVQIGDRMGPDTITGIGVYDPLANAAHDEAGNIRTMRRGDHRVAFWASTAAGQIVVRANHLDSDQDGLLDHWETTGIDMDQDGIVDLRLSDYGADPFTRDLFLQVDWVGKPGFDFMKPAGGVFTADLAGTYSLFEGNLRNAEKLSGPLYGARIDGSAPADIKAGVVPHVDAGTGLDPLFLPYSINLNAGVSHGGNYVGMPGNSSVLPAVVYFGQPGLAVPGVNVRGFQDIKDNFLGKFDKDARMLAFHYVVFAPFQDFRPNFPKTPFSATITSVFDAFTIEVNQPLSAFPGIGSGGPFLLVASGAANGITLQIKSTATSGVTGNAIFGLSGALTPLPAVGDTVAFLDGSSGLSEVAFAPSPDNNSLPGNDFIVSAGALGVLQGIPPNQCLEAETVSHELGHTLGLRHGGTDHFAFKDSKHPPYNDASYVSVMSYSWQLECTPQALVPNYAGPTDNTFDDYGHLQFNFPDVMFHLSTSLGQARGEGYPADMQQQDPEQTLLDVIAKNGPIDTVPPSITITTPGPGANVAAGGNMVVNITATDNVRVTRVSAAFDINGNGVTDAADAVPATQTGANTYQAVFPAVGGSAGARTVSAIAFDGWSNSTRAAINVNVVNGATPPPLLALSTSSGSGSSQTFTAVYSDTAGLSNLAWGEIMFAVAIDGGGQPFCQIHYDSVGNGLYLYADAGPFIGPVTPGTVSTTLKNSSCSVNTQQSSVTKSGNNVTVNVAVTFTAGFAGTKSTYLRAKDNAAQDTGFVLEGNWTVTTTAGVGALRFVPITPCRVADTRNPTGPFGAPNIAGGTSRVFNIPSSACGIPSTAQAYSLNVAVVPTGVLAYLTLWPTGQAQPFVSTINSDGRVKSNAAIVPAGTSGSISAFASNTTDLVLDINGYFIAATDPTGLAFFPITPCRIADTRNANGPLGGPSLGTSQSRTFPVQTACNLPSTVQAYSLNFAAVPPSILAFVTAWPTGQPKPFVSSLNDPTGTITANAVIVPAGTNGNIDIFASNTTDLVIDINGYFAPMSTGGLSLYGVTPCRVLDTRNPAGSAPITSLDVAVSASGCGIPATAQAHVVNVTVVPPGLLGYITMWPQGTPKPFVSTLNASDGAITSNLALVPTTNGTISVFASAPTHVIIDISAYFAQ